MHVVFRADAGSGNGTGHVVRCLSLANELLRHGAEVSFVTRGSEDIVGLIERSGARAIQLGPLNDDDDRRPGSVRSVAAQKYDREMTQRLLPEGTEILVVDHYGLDATWERELRRSIGRLAVIDDLANRLHDCDLLIDQNWYGEHSGSRYDGLVPDGAELRLGPRYALLQPEYRAKRRRAAPSWPPRSVLVSFGGTDPGGETLTALAALANAEFADLDVTAVIGSADRVGAQLQAAIDRMPRTQLRVAVPSLALLLAESDLAIGASGAATWERLALDVPAIVTTTSRHQSGVTEALHAHGVVCWIGLTGEVGVDDYRRALHDLVTAPRPRVPSVVDGFGAMRVAMDILRVNEGPLGVRPAERLDAASFVGLVAESTGRGPDVMGGPSAWFDDMVHFEGLLETALVWLLELANRPIGFAVLAGGDLRIMLERDEAARRSTQAIVEALAPVLPGAIDAGSIQRRPQLIEATLSKPTN